MRRRSDMIAVPASDVKNGVILHPQNALLDYVRATKKDITSEPSAQRLAKATSNARTAGTLQTSPFCGDGVCDPGENCTTCAPDCLQVGDDVFWLAACCHSIVP